jgi:hypothetical protein
VLVPVAVLTGCGGAGHAPTLPPPKPPAHVVPLNTAALCLNADLFYIESYVGKTITGTSPQGVNFRIRFYRTIPAASRAFARLQPRFAVRYATAVVDFAGNPPAKRGGPPRVLEHLDFATIRHCLERPGVVTDDG